MQRILDSTSAPATVSNMRCDYLAANQLGRALYSPLFESREQPPNSARFTFLDPAAQEFFLDWEKAAKDLVATPALDGRPQPLRPSALRSRRRAIDPQRRVSHLVGRAQRPLPPDGTKRLHHPVVGELELSYEVMELSADTGLRLAIFTAEPGSRSQEALNLLASWAATPDQLTGEHPAVGDARRP